MVIIPIQDLLDYSSCYDLLEKVLHPDGVCCSQCGRALSSTQKPHKYASNGLPSFRCRELSCRSVFNIFTGTTFQGIHYDCKIIILMLRGFAQGKTTLHLSNELKVNYKNLLDWRHRLQEFAYENRDWSALKDKAIESDEVFINAGEKGEKHENPDDPPRVRANKKKA